MTVMVITHFTIVLNISSKICGNKFFNITTATSDDLDSLSLKNILRSLAHVSGQHYNHSHLS